MATLQMSKFFHTGLNKPSFRHTGHVHGEGSGQEKEQLLTPDASQTETAC